MIWLLTVYHRVRWFFFIDEKYTAAELDPTIFLKQVTFNNYTWLKFLLFKFQNRAIAQSWIVLFGSLGKIPLTRNDRIQHFEQRPMSLSWVSEYNVWHNKVTRIYNILATMHHRYKNYCWLENPCYNFALAVL